MYSVLYSGVYVVAGATLTSTMTSSPHSPDPANFNSLCRTSLHYYPHSRHHTDPEQLYVH